MRKGPVPFFFGFAILAIAAAQPVQSSAEAVFAGGCYWATEEAFERVAGVSGVQSGFASGLEAVRVRYDASRVSYAQLVEIFWHNIDPVDGGGQFCDRGAEYRTAIFVSDDQQRAAADASKRALEASGRFKQPIATAISAAAPFQLAPPDEQDFYKKHAVQFRAVEEGCRRPQKLAAMWK